MYLHSVHEKTFPAADELDDATDDGVVEGAAGDLADDDW
jgi:hypothetical protein